MSVELVQEVLSDANINSDIQLVPWARAFNSASKNPNTALFTVTRNAEREGLFHWIGPVCTMNSMIYKLSKNKKIPQFNTLKEMAPYTVGTVLGWADEKFLTGLGYLKVDGVPDSKQNILKIINGRVDLIQDYDSGLAMKLREMNLAPDLLTPVYHLKEISPVLYLVLNKNSNPELVQQIQKSYNKVINSTKGKKIISDWGSAF